MTIPNLITRGIGPAGGPHWIITAGLGLLSPPPPYHDPISAPYQVTDFMITGLTALARMLELLRDNAAFDTVLVHLYTNNTLVLLPNVLVADFDEADFTGYVAQALDDAVLIPMLNPLGDLVATFPHVDFVPTGTAVGNTVYGWWMDGVVAGVGTVVIAAGEFETPLVVTGPLTPVQVEPRFPVGQPRGT